MASMTRMTAMKKSIYFQEKIVGLWENDTVASMKIMIT